MRKIVCGLLWSPSLFVVYCDHQVCNPFFVVALCLSLLCRGDRVFALGLWLSLLCRGDWVLVLCLASCVEMVVLERGVVYSLPCNLIPRWRFPVWRSCVDIVKILLCEGRDVEQWLEPRNISWYLCLIHYLLTLSLISCIALHCSYHLNAWYWLYAHTCVELRELLIAPQLIM